jgi:hypothetical protein
LIRVELYHIFRTWDHLRIQNVQHFSNCRSLAGKAQTTQFSWLAFERKKNRKKQNRIGTKKQSNLELHLIPRKILFLIGEKETTSVEVWFGKVACFAWKLQSFLQLNYYHWRFRETTIIRCIMIETLWYVRYYIKLSYYEKTFL